MVVKVKASFEKTRQIINTYNSLVYSDMYSCLYWLMNTKHFKENEL